MSSSEETKRRTMNGLLSIVFCVPIPLGIAAGIASGELDKGPIALGGAGLSFLVSIVFWFRS